MLKKLDYIMIVVSDMGRSIEFYRDKLGFSLKSESENWTEFSVSSTVIALHGEGVKNGSKRDAMHVGTCTMGFYVKDVERSYKELKTKGVRFVMSPKKCKGEGITLAICVDPDGLPINPLEIERKRFRVA